uniref:Uncharacterized protein n=1 Tax=Craspedostauros australis TaxID=1486917 RepID=A0A7R9WXT0_9STRA
MVGCVRIINVVIGEQSCFGFWSLLPPVLSLSLSLCWHWPQEGSDLHASPVLLERAFWDQYIFWHRLAENDDSSVQPLGFQGRVVSTYIKCNGLEYQYYILPRRAGVVDSELCHLCPKREGEARSFYRCYGEFGG